MQQDVLLRCCQDSGRIQCGLLCLVVQLLLHSVLGRWWLLVWHVLCFLLCGRLHKALGVLPLLLLLLRRLLLLLDCPILLLHLLLVWLMMMMMMPAAVAGACKMHVAVHSVAHWLRQGCALQICRDADVAGHHLLQGRVG